MEGKMKYFLLVTGIILAGCSSPVTFAATSGDPTNYAEQYVGLHERTDRAALRELTGVDPVHTEWCAAFVNAILEKDGVPNLYDLGSKYPLVARQFLEYGQRINRADIQRGDLVIFPRGRAGWQGHVGFYVGKTLQDGKEVWIILGGNQDNTVSYAYYNPAYAIGIRRYTAE